MATVFLFALSERLVASFIFFLRFGPHATSGIETWFYYGVAGGRFDLHSPWDPTWWLLKAIGALYRPDTLLLHAVYLASATVSSLSAALFTGLAARLHDKRTGLLAGLIYASMVLPMFNSTATTTHDVFGYPWMLLALLSVVLLFRTEGRIRVLFPPLCFLSLFFGAHVGPSIMVGAATIVVYVAWEAVRALVPSKWREGWPVFAAFFAFMMAAFLLVHLRLMPKLILEIIEAAKTSRGLDLRAQARAGSGDLGPTSLGDYWLRFNFLIFFLPVGLYAAFRKKDVLSWAFLAAGALAAMTADRGTRPLSFAVALIAALALIHWKPIYTWPTLLWSALLVIRLTKTFDPVYAVAFPFVGVLVYGILQSKQHDQTRLAYLAGLLWVFAVAVFTANAPLSSNEAQYKLYRSLWDRPADRGSILTHWGQGYMAEALSGIPSALSPERLDIGLAGVYWLWEADAAQAMAEQNMRYLVLPADCLRVEDQPASNDGPATGPLLNIHCYSSPTLMAPMPAPVSRDIRALEQTLVFRLIYHRHELDHFRLIGEQTDAATGKAMLAFERITP